MDQPVLFGRYRLVAPAGSGGTAQVWRAVDERTGDEVAVKRLHPVVFGSDAGRQRLVREFRSLRDLHHPNIVRVRDLEIGTDEAALVLDFVDGPSVREHLDAGTPLTVAEAVAITSDVAAALEAAHLAGLVHRDVSPGNILLAPDGRARLTDFGIARASNDHTAVTGTGMVVGTLHYVSPEVLRGEPATPSSDLYGLAAVTYEIVAGRPAFPVSTPVALVEAQRAGAPSIGGVDPGLDAVIRRALSADPADRPVTVAAFASEVRLAAGLPLPDDRVTDRMSVPAAALGAGAIAAAAASQAGATVPPPVSERAAEPPRSSAAPHGARRASVPVALAAAAAFAVLAFVAAALGGPLSPDAAVGGITPPPRAPAATRTQPPETAPPTAAPVVRQAPPDKKKGQERAEEAKGDREDRQEGGD